jgi:hypothetical protein
MANDGYDSEGYPTDDDQARQDALGAELLRAWSPLLTGFKRQDKQGARIDRGFGPKEPPIVPPGSTV